MNQRDLHQTDIESSWRDMRLHHDAYTYDTSAHVKNFYNIKSKTKEMSYATSIQRYNHSDPSLAFISISSIIEYYVFFTESHHEE